jgi:hypothetical protein
MEDGRGAEWTEWERGGEVQRVGLGEWVFVPVGASLHTRPHLSPPLPPLQSGRRQRKHARAPTRHASPMPRDGRTAGRGSLMAEWGQRVARWWRRQGPEGRGPVGADQLIGVKSWVCVAKGKASHCSPAERGDDPLRVWFGVAWRANQRAIKQGHKPRPWTRGQWSCVGVPSATSAVRSV